MVKYVKICPRCGRANDELADACERDGEFLGMVPATPEEKPSPPSAPHAERTEDTPPVCNVQMVQIGRPTALLFLDLPALGRSYEVRDGWILGQAHGTSTAEIQLEGAQGLNFVHRNHCRFSLREDGWYVTPLAQPSYTNPTLLNQRKIAPGESAKLRNGDRLSLSNVVLTVRLSEL